jgi:hypothetical protein
MSILVKKYENNWDEYFNKIDKLAKERKVIINNKAWRKLRGFHFDKYVDSLDKPFGFVASMFLTTDYRYKIRNLRNIYEKLLTKRTESFRLKDRSETLAATYRRFR